MIVESSGQGTIMSFFTLVLGLIVVVALLPILNELVGVVLGMNLGNLLMGSTVNLLIGISGLLMVILFIMGVVSDFQVKQRYVE